MTKLSINEIDVLLTERRLTKSKHLRQIDTLDTEIIGLKIERERKVEIEQRVEQSRRDASRSK